MSGGVWSGVAGCHVKASSAPAAPASTTDPAVFSSVLPLLAHRRTGSASTPTSMAPSTSSITHGGGPLAPKQPQLPWSCRPLSALRVGGRTLHCCS